MDKENRKILVVEDDATMREIVVHKLTTSGFRVIEAADGREAVEQWGKEKPDLVLLDLMLPEMDGFQVLETMRGHKDAVIAKAPVIVLSNLFSKDDLSRAKSYSISDFLVKAYHTTEEILDRINAVLNQQ